MRKFRDACQKVSSVLEYIIGVSLLICLFIGGLGFVGYLAAFCIGGDAAMDICAWLYDEFYAFLIKISTYTTLCCFLLMYLKGNAAWINPIKYWSKEKERGNK